MGFLSLFFSIYYNLFLKNHDFPVILGEI